MKLMTLKKRYQVFISSTFADLADERRHVMETILKCDCFPAGMEMFPALDMEQFTYIKSIIDDSDYYILIIAGRYGTLTSDGISYTEKEYDYAVEKGIPVLAFLKRDIESIPVNKTALNRNTLKKLMAFRQKVEKNKLISYWDDPSELTESIVLSLHKAIKELPRAGWVRRDINAGSTSPNRIKKHKHYMSFEVIINDEVEYQSDQIGAILSPDGQEVFSGLFNATKMAIIKAYPKIDEFVSTVYHMACEAAGEDNADEVLVSFIEYDTDILHFGIKIFSDSENSDALKYGFLDWTESEYTLISGEKWMQ